MTASHRSLPATDAARRRPLLPLLLAAAGAGTLALAAGAPVAAAPPPGVTVDIGWVCLPNGGDRFFWDVEVRNESGSPVDVQLVIGSYASATTTIGGNGGAFFGGGPYQPDGLPSTVDVVIDGQVADSASVSVVDCLPDEAPEAQWFLDCPDPVEEPFEDIAVATVLRSKGTATTFTVGRPDGTTETVTVADAQEQRSFKVDEGDLVDAWVSVDGGATRLAELVTTVDCVPDPTVPTDPSTTLPTTTAPAPGDPAPTDPGTEPSTGVPSPDAPAQGESGGGAPAQGASGGGAPATGPGAAPQPDPVGSTLPATGASPGLLLAAVASTLAGSATVALARRRR